ncbi:MAG: hypothetical protein GX753_02890 [Erysipelothrix sp.]|nr:hypothetical protein [Erysipelothrix sp.]
MKNTWTALLAIIGSAIIYRFADHFIGGKLLTFLYLVLLLVIGFFMSNTRGKNSRWLGKVVISLVVVFIFGIRLELFVFDEFYEILKTVGLYGSFLDLLLIYCGWVFYQV